MYLRVVTSRGTNVLSKLLWIFAIYSSNTVALRYSVTGDCHSNFSGSFHRNLQFNKNAFAFADRKSKSCNLTLEFPWPHLWPWPQTSQTKLNWCSDSKISIFKKITLTLILKLDLDIVQMYHHTNNEASVSTASKVIARTDKHTDRHTNTRTHNTHIHTYTLWKHYLYRICVR